MFAIDWFIRVVRTPLALVAAALVVGTTLCALLVEVPTAIFWLVVLSIFGTRKSIKESWLADCPNATQDILAILFNLGVWAWSAADSPPYADLEDGPLDSAPRMVFNGVASIATFIFLVSVLGWWGVVGPLLVVGAIIFAIRFFSEDLSDLFKD